MTLTWLNVRGRLLFEMALHYYRSFVWRCDLDLEGNSLNEVDEVFIEVGSVQFSIDEKVFTNSI